MSDSVNNTRDIGKFLLASAMAVTSLGFTLAEIRLAMQAVVSNDELWEGLECAAVRGPETGAAIIQDMKAKRDAVKKAERCQ